MRILVATDVVGRGIDVSEHLAHHQLRHAAVVATTTCTASAAPAAWAAKAWPTRSSRTEEGGELTRIEMLINRLLKRDEIEGFMAVSTVVPYATTAVAGAGGTPESPGEPAPPPAPKKTPPGGRPRKRHRKGL